MLIKKTHWLERDEAGYSFRYRKALEQQLFVCISGLSRLFHIPNNTRRVRFYLYDRPSKNRIKCKLGFDECYSWLEVSRKTQVGIWEYVSSQFVRKLLAKQKHYYVECEYE